MFGNNREDIRRFYQSTWQKHQAGTALQGLELLVAQVIRQHPEYHKLITQDTALAQDFSPEDGQTNPFLHMGMHITLAEQLGSDRPGGICALHQQISQKTGDIHQAEHQMMECLGLVLWEAQKQNRTPDEKNYLACLRKLI
jgi:hypothetical protein